jgi:hypothetical protein
MGHGLAATGLGLAALELGQAMMEPGLARSQIRELQVFHPSVVKIPKQSPGLVNG